MRWQRASDRRAALQARIDQWVREHEAAKTPRDRAGEALADWARLYVSGWHSYSVWSGDESWWHVERREGGEVVEVFRVECSERTRVDCLLAQSPPVVLDAMAATPHCPPELRRAWEDAR